MADLSRVPVSIKELVMPAASHLAVFRDALGVVTSQRVMCLPEASDAEAVTAAKRLQTIGEVVCDVFEISETRRVGGVLFRKDQQG